MKKSSKGSFQTYFTKLDCFGYPIMVNYRGSQHYQTSYGTFVTLICAMLILSFSAIKLKDLVERTDAIFTKNAVLVQLDQIYDKIQAKDNRFDFAFSLMDKRTWKYSLENSQRYFRVNARRVDMYKTPTISYDKIPLPIIPGTQSKHFLNVAPA